jgi:tetratricopeptide (TPR) repeat protein/tRNA A-37 threonylcarbamoyl transferase component Bud32
MSAIRVCPHGHQWEPATGPETTAYDGDPGCPVCGAAGADPDTATVSPTAVLDSPPAALGTDVQQVTLAVEASAPAPADRAPDATLDLETGQPAVPAGGSDPTIAVPSSVAFNEATVPDAGRAGPTPAGDAADRTLGQTVRSGPPAEDGEGEPTVAERDVTLDLADATAHLAGVPEPAADGPDVTQVTASPARPATASPGRAGAARTIKEGSAPRRSAPPGGAAKTRLDPDSLSQPGGPRPEVAGYEILGELGRGGMGVVYKARQPGLNRDVALKMVLRAGHVGAAELARFRMEAEAVAQLQHPNIVQVYEVGEQDGCPFFSLEFVEGETLADRIQSTPQPPRFAAAMTLDLARAMEQAHRRGIIHRDLKPANVLLTADGTPKITDFGLAKRYAEDDAGQTRTGAIMGTPSYMAPEQAKGQTKDTGPAADIYSLGAILYDLLAGRPPFRGVTILDTLQQVRTLEPVPPRRLDATVPRDLETICLKCLEKEPAKRYATAGELAEDLRRFLADEPIHARPTPWWERCLKWARRRPATAALIAVSTLAAVSLLTVGGLWLNAAREAAEERERQQARVAKLERQRARDAEKQQRIEKEARAKAEREYRRAETNFRYARAAVDQMLTGVGQLRLAHEPRMERLRRDLLADALAFYQRFLRARGTDASVRAETARAQERVAAIQQMLGQPDQAEKAYRASLDLFRELPAPYAARPECRQDLATCYNNLGTLLVDAGRYAAARTAYRQARDLRQKLADERPGNPEYLQDLSDSYDNLGAVEQKAKHLKQARRDYSRALELQQRLADQFPGRPAYRHRLARRHNNLGQVLGAIGQRSAAAGHFTKARQILTGLLARSHAPEYRHELAATHHHVGFLERDVNPKDAEAAYRACLALRDALAAEFPTVPGYREELAAAYNDLAVLLQATGRGQEADEAFGKALAVQEKIAADFPRVPDFRRQLGSAYHNRANLLAANRPREAERLYGRALDLFTRLAKEYPDVPAYRREQASTHANLGALWFAGGALDKAEQAFHKALAIEERLTERHGDIAGHWEDLAGTQLNLGVVLQVKGKLPEAARWYRAAAKTYGQLAKDAPGEPGYRHQWAVCCNNLGNLLRTLNRPKEAEEAWRRALDLLARLAEQLPGVPSYRQELARTYNELGIFLAGARRGEEAEKAWGKAIALQQELVHQFPQQSAYRRELARSYGNLGILLVRVNRLREAEQQFRRSNRLFEDLTAQGPVVAADYRELIAGYTNLANLLDALGRSDGADTSRRRVLELQEKLVAAFPREAPFRAELGQTLTARAGRLLEEEEPAKARPLLEAAAVQLRAAVELRPAEAGYRRALDGALGSLAGALLALQDHAAAAKAAEELAATVAGKPREGPRVARVLARCAGLASGDRALAKPKRQELAGAYGSRAVELLRKAVAAGWRDGKALRESADFEPLRTRDDFKKLVAEVR